jgi:short subunit fatty acids transporter
MASMRAMFVLAAMLSFATPQMSWGAIESSLSGSGGIVLAAPASAHSSQIARAVSKTDKTFGSGLAISTDFVALYHLIGSIDYVSAQTCDAPHLDLDLPPLAPRPPPLS